MINPFRRQRIDINALPDEEKKRLIEEMLQEKAAQPLGDGKAVFLDDGYHEEFEDLKKQESGLKPWYKRIGL